LICVKAIDAERQYARYHVKRLCHGTIFAHASGDFAHRGPPAIRRLLPLSLTFDHRVVTGGEAARFLVTLKSNLELMT
jgi:2-oxoacid dehydrogenases acyltransferase (catalytic domain)